MSQLSDWLIRVVLRKTGNREDENVNYHEAYKTVFREYPDILDVYHLAELLQVSTKTAYKLLSEKKIECLKVGRQYKIPKASIIHYLKIADDNIR